MSLDPDVEEMLRREACSRDVGVDQIVNEMVRLALSPNATDLEQGKPFVEKTYSMGPPRVELTMALADELEDQERIRKIRLAEGP